MKLSNSSPRIRFIEFLVSGVLGHVLILGLIFEFVLDRTLRLPELLLALIIIVPYSAVTEYVIDHPRFWSRLLRQDAGSSDDAKDASL